MQGVARPRITQSLNRIVCCPPARSCLARLSSLLIAEQESKRLRSFVRILGGELITLKQNGVDCENLEYLKGETHYIAACVRKRCLLERGVLREDLPVDLLLSPANVNLDALLVLGRVVAT